MNIKTSLIGSPEIRKDASSKANGSVEYIGDLNLPDTTFGVIVRSPHHRAQIRGINLNESNLQQGVIAVLTSADVPGTKTFGSLLQDQPVLAVDEVRHIGEPVVLVVAKSLEIARLAARKIIVDYVPLPSVHDPIIALSDDSPRVHPGGNLLSQFNLEAGDLSNGFSLAEVILENEFSVQRVAPGYMEMENSLARYNPDGTMTVWVSSQEPYHDRTAIAAVLGIPEEKVQVMSTVIGGAFGGKEDSSLQVITAFAAFMTKGTVKIVNNRRESFQAHPKRHPAKIYLKLGAKKDGTLTALHGQVWMNTGAYASYGPAVGSLLTEMVTGPYRIPNVSVETKVVYTHSPYSGAMRGFGSPQAHFAIESTMDMLAESLGMDAADIRAKNILHPGDTLPSRVRVNETAVGLERCLELVVESRDRLRCLPVTPGKVGGVGFALAMQSMGLGAKVPDVSTHRLEWLPDGKVLIRLGATDLGQGLTTIAEQILADALGLPFDRVITAPFDSYNTPNGGPTCASRMTFLVGNAMLSGSAALQSELIREAARTLKKTPGDLKYLCGQVILPDGTQFSAGEFASRAAEDGRFITAEASAVFPYPDNITPQHLPVGMPHMKFVFGAQVARVEVDPDLGTVEVKDLIAIHDLGKIINRIAAEGQIEGGVSMGLGYALYEDMSQKSNGNWVDSFTEYLLPTACDMPNNLEIIMLEYPETDGPHGAKGLAEVTVVPTAPAIANAVFDAVGVRVQDLPITPEKIYSKIHQPER
jgi:xanthine dehydrogenase molybdenum-binding subunit